MAVAFRMTMLLRNTEGIKAKMLAKTARKKQAVLAAQVDNAEDEFGVAQTFVPRRTNFLANHMVLRFTRGGYNYFLGFLRGEFVGLLNPVTQQIVTRFYADDVIRGNRHMIGNDFLMKTRNETRARVMERLRVALNMA